MSARGPVPAAVPSLLHGSSPWLASGAKNRSRRPRGIGGGRKSQEKLGEAICETRAVPAAVPSLVQRSQPEKKKSRPRATFSRRALKGNPPWTGRVPAAVPSLLQSWLLVPSGEAKK